MLVSSRQGSGITVQRTEWTKCHMLSGVQTCLLASIVLHVLCDSRLTALNALPNTSKIIVAVASNCKEPCSELFATVACYCHH